MAKALFHKNQRVWVKPVGTWALIEEVIPHWVKDVEEPLRISYECGLGRTFDAKDLSSEQAKQTQGRADIDDEDDMMLELWHISRRTPQWRTGGDSNNPGSFPVVVTDEGDYGGWRVKGSEYDRDPQRIEHQARMIVHTPDLLRIARRLAEEASEKPETLSEDMKQLAGRCATVLRFVYQLDDEVAEAAE